jgi:DNA polymerase family B
MAHCTGWIFDISIEQNRAVVWFKTTEGNILRLTDRYQPNFIKEFQTELLYTLFDCNNSTEVLSKGYENGLLFVTQTIDKLMTGEIQPQDLVVTKILGQNIDKYKSLFPHVSAAILLAKKGIEMNAGEDVEYIYTNTHHDNPLYRVMPKALVEENGDFNYDKEKYRDLLLEAAETVLSIFGFNRTAYGDVPKKNMKWWQRLNEEKLRHSSYTADRSFANGGNGGNGNRDNNVRVTPRTFCASEVSINFLT